MPKASTEILLTELAAERINGKKLRMSSAQSGKRRCFKGIKKLPCRYRGQIREALSSLFNFFLVTGNEDMQHFATNA